MRTLTDIIPPSRRQPPSQDTLPPSTLSPRGRGNSRFPLSTIIAVLLIVALSTGTLFYFSDAIVTVIPQAHTATLTDSSFTATAGVSDLAFEVVTVQKMATQSVTSSGTKAVASSAQGTIVITNAQSVTQKLIVNTRFQTTNGLIFKIHSPVTVPGAKGDIPGNVTVTVYADKPGSEYNVGPTTFTLPGLSGTSQFTQVRAQSNATMTGGASGNEPTVAPEVEKAMRAALMDSLALDLASSIATQVPQGYVLLQGASSVSFIPMPTTLGTNSGQADIKEQGTMRGIALSSIALAKAIATNTLGSAYKGEAVTLGTMANLTLKPKSTLPEIGDPSFMFNLSGTATLISNVDEARISAAIAGKTRADAESILKQYPEVAKANLILRPFWRTTFPQDPSQIKVEILKLGGN